MNDELKKIQKDVARFHQKVASTVTPLYPGIELCYLTFSTDSFSVRHNAISHIIQINYCKLHKNINLLVAIKRVIGLI